MVLTDSPLSPADEIVWRETDVQRIGLRVFRLTSQTDPHSGKTATYNLATNDCTCEAHQHGSFCWHMGAARLAEDFLLLWQERHGRPLDHVGVRADGHVYAREVACLDEVAG